MLHPLATVALANKFEQGLSYAEYVAAGKPHERENWAQFHAKVQLTPAQHKLIGGFQRTMNLLVLSGTWCGDCVQQIPFIDHIAAAGPKTGEGSINVRYLERDLHQEFSDAVKICGGNRVPVTIFMNEDFEFVSLFGDRTLNRYRALAGRQLGASCPLPGAPVAPDEVAAQLQDWVDEFERVHLLLRLSGKLRQRYAD